MSKSLQKIIDYLIDNPGKTTIDMSKDMKMSRNTIMGLVKQHDFLFRTEKIITGYGYRNTPFIAKAYFLVDDAEDDILEQKVIKKRFEPSQVKHHPIMCALYGF